MTILLEKAIKRAEALSPEEQDALAAQILDSIEDEEGWDRFYRENADRFRALAQQADAEHERGDTRPIEELLGE